MTHTPGPWNRNIKPARKYNTIYAGRNTHVAHLATSDLSDEEIESNCALITTAPELLEALRALTDKAESMLGDHKSVIIDARAAIDKATKQ